MMESCNHNHNTEINCKICNILFPIYYSKYQVIFFGMKCSGGGRSKNPGAQRNRSILRQCFCFKPACLKLKVGIFQTFLDLLFKRFNRMPILAIFLWNYIGEFRAIGRSKNPGGGGGHLVMCGGHYLSSWLR